MKFATILIWICILGMIACFGYEFCRVAAECGYHGIEAFKFSCWFFFQDGIGKVNTIMNSNCFYDKWQDAARALYEKSIEDSWLCGNISQEFFWQKRYERGGVKDMKEGECETIFYSTSFWERFFGLMLKKDFKHIMLFSFPKPSTVFIHSFFMRFTIDVICCDEKGHIIESFTLKPWRVKIVKGVKYIAERKTKK